MRMKFKEALGSNNAHVFVDYLSSKPKTWFYFHNDEIKALIKNFFNTQDFVECYPKFIGIIPQQLHSYLISIIADVPDPDVLCYAASVFRDEPIEELEESIIATGDSRGIINFAAVSRSDKEKFYNAVLDSGDSAGICRAYYMRENSPTLEQIPKFIKGISSNAKCIYDFSCDLNGQLTAEDMSLLEEELALICDAKFMCKYLKDVTNYPAIKFAKAIMDANIPRSCFYLNKILLFIEDDPKNFKYEIAKYIIINGSLTDIESLIKNRCVNHEDIVELIRKFGNSETLFKISNKYNFTKEEVLNSIKRACDVRYAYYLFQKYSFSKQELIDYIISLKNPQMILILAEFFEKDALIINNLSQALINMQNDDKNIEVLCQFATKFPLSLNLILDFIAKKRDSNLLTEFFYQMQKLTESSKGNKKR